MTDFFCFSFNQRASFATVVVLPAPCKPAIKITAGGVTLRLSVSFAAPIIAVSSSFTTLTRACPGVRLFKTLSPSAFSLTCSMNSRTTGKATSASSNAMRTSRRVSLILSSVKRPTPRKLRTVCPRRSDKPSNIILYTCNKKIQLR